MNGIITSNAMHGQVGTAINNEINNSHNTVIVGLKTVYDLMGTEFLQTISDFQGSVGETSETAILNEDTLNATKTKITNAGTSQTEYETSFNQVYDSINDLISLSSPSSIVSTYLSSTSKILQEVIDKVNSFENTATEIKVDNMLQVLSQQTEVGKQAQDLSYTDPQFVEFASYSQLSEKVQEIDKELTEAKEKAKKEAEEAEKKAREEWKRNHPVTAWLQDTSANIGAWWEGVKQGTKDIDIPFVRDTLLFAEGFIGQAGSTLSSVSIMASEFIELVPELGIVLASRIIGFEAPEWVEKDVSGTLDNAYSAGKYMYRFFTDGETRDQAWESLKKSAGDAWDKFWEDPAYNAGGATFEVASFFFGIGEAKAALTAAKGAETFLEGAKLFLKAAKNEAVQNGDNFIRNLKRLYHKKDDLARILAEGGSNSLDNLLRMRDNIGEFLSKHPLASMFGEEFSFAGVGRYFGGHYGDDFGRHTARVYNMADEVERGASRVSSKFSSEAFEGGVEAGKGLADDAVHLNEVEEVINKTSKDIITYEDGVPRLKEEIEINFNRNAKHDEAEFGRQLGNQEKGMNELTVQEYLDNRKQYIAEGRSKEARWAQKAAREEASSAKYGELIESGMSRLKARIETWKWLRTQAALHDPDQIAGGYAKRIGGMGDRRINNSIGAQWRYRIDAVDEQIQALAEQMTPEQLQNTYLNVRLTY